MSQLLIKRTVFLPKGSPGIYRITNIQGDLRNPQINNPGNPLLYRGDLDLLVEYLAVADGNDPKKTIWAEDEGPPATKPWQAMITLPFEANQEITGANPPPSPFKIEKINWLLIAARAIEVEFYLTAHRPEDYTEAVPPAPAVAALPRIRIEGQQEIRRASAPQVKNPILTKPNHGDILNQHPLNAAKEVEAAKEQAVIFVEAEPTSTTIMADLPANTGVLSQIPVTEAEAPVIFTNKPAAQVISGEEASIKMAEELPGSTEVLQQTRVKEQAEIETAAHFEHEPATALPSTDPLKPNTIAEPPQNTNALRQNAVKNTIVEAASHSTTATLPQKDLPFIPAEAKKAGSLFKLRYCQVQPNDDLISLALRNGVTPAALAARNKLNPDNPPLKAGMFLMMP